MTKNKISIVIPVYNESTVVKGVIEELKLKRPNDNIIVINDGSSDNSINVLLSIPNIYVLSHEINLGQGAALQTGINMSRILDSKYVVTFDSDGQHSVDDIEKFYNEIESKKLDIVIGSRFLSGSSSNVSFFKKNFLKLSTLFTYLVSQIKLSDSHNGFRIINIEDNPLFEIKHNGMSHASEIVDLIKTLNMKYTEKSCTIIYTDYSMAKGQSIWNSVNIVLEIFVQRLTKWFLLK